MIHQSRCWLLALGLVSLAASACSINDSGSTAGRRTSTTSVVGDANGDGDVVTMPDVIPVNGGVGAANEALDDTVLAAMQKHNVPALTAIVVKNGAIAWSRAYGYADLPTRRKATTATAFGIGSVQKLITATAVMQLSEKGQLDLDKDINEYLAFRVRSPVDPSVPISTRMLLAHTAGFAHNIPDSIDTKWYEDGIAETIAIRDSLPRVLVPGKSDYNEATFTKAAPGTTFEYSNTGVSLAAHVVEAISGSSYEAYCRDRIFAPLGMKSAAARIADFVGDDFAMPHVDIDGKTHRLQPLKFFTYPAGEALVSADDMGRFLLAFSRGGELDGQRILATETFGAMLESQYPDANNTDEIMGLGWYANTFEGHLLFGHDGATVGVTAHLRLRVEDGFGYFIIANNDPETLIEPVTQLGGELLRAFGGD